MSTKDFTNIKFAREWFDETHEMLFNRGMKPELEILSLKAFNHLTWGLHKKEMTVIGGRTSNCKSVLAASIAWDLAKQGHKVYYASLEMAVPRILERLFCSEYLVDNYELMCGGMNKSAELRDKWKKFIHQASATKLILSDMIGRDWSDIKKVDEIMTTFPDVVIIDHINEISGGKSKLEALESYLDNFRALAIRRNFALIICAQINRSTYSDEDKLPKMHQLKGTGALEEKADNIWLTHYEFQYGRDEAKKNNLKIIVAKSRYSATGHIDVYIHPEYSRLSDDGRIFNQTNEPVRTFGERQEEDKVDLQEVQCGISNDSDTPDWSE